MQIEKIERKLDWNKFEPLFGSWAGKIKPFFDNGGFEPIYKFLKLESSKGKKIAPISDLTYRCFQETPINECKVIIAGFCPYHTFIKGTPVADGLCMGCSVTEKLQPSLTSFYWGLEEELHNGMNVSYYRNPDLSFLAKQGVLLFNVSLTTEMGKPGNHLSIWHDFTKYFFEEVVGYTGIPVLFMGNEAYSYQRYITPFTHTFKIKHPAYYARLDQPTDFEGHIKKINQIIYENNGYKITWLDDDLPF
jgi:uracil-DNA glycosylase